MIDPSIKDQLDIELEKVIYDVNGRVPFRGYYERLEELRELEHSHTSTHALRKAKKRERLNRARGRRGSVR